MKKITNTVLQEIYTSPILDEYFSGKSLCVFDIETTGLSRETSQIILSGFAFPQCDNGTLEVTQIFAQSLEDEVGLIKETLSILSSVDVALTYNGRAFDIGFLIARANHHGIRIPHLPYIFDLLPIVRRATELSNFLPNFKQKTVEKFLGHSSNRKDEIDGRESVILYYKYLKTKDPALENIILLHNSDDCIQLYKCLAIIEKVDFHKAMMNYGFPLDKNHIIESIDIKHSTLHIKGRQKDNAISYLFFGDNISNYTYNFNQPKLTFDVKVPLSVYSHAYYLDLSEFNFTINIESSNKNKDFLVLYYNSKPNCYEINCFSKLLMTEIIKSAKG